MFKFLGAKYHPVQWALLGAVLSLGAPIGLWILLKIGFHKSEEVFFTVYLYSGVSTLIAFSVFGFAAGSLMQKIEHLSFYDHLTGLFNRRYFLEQFDELLALTQRYPQPLTLMMLDLDHFKQVNDRFGHQIGDQTLKAVANVIGMECRQADTPARYGGEEFIIVCPNTNENEGRQLAERIREAVKGLSSAKLGFRGTQTISIGMMTSGAGQNLEGMLLIEKADRALYQAKANGRDQVVLG
ncbi:MAG: GGDEF domain-containing protein [SAR324 cluster bacterium]|nr:GGDEF domain-containing protein [SAR324 cluster bacterium]